MLFLVGYVLKNVYSSFAVLICENGFVVKNELLEIIRMRHRSKNLMSIIIFGVGREGL